MAAVVLLLQSSLHIPMQAVRTRAMLAPVLLLVMAATVTVMAVIAAVASKTMKEAEETEWMLQKLR